MSNQLPSSLTQERGSSSSNQKWTSPAAPREQVSRRFLLVTALYLVVGLRALIPVIDLDIWWHLRTGQWIIEQGMVPTTDPFSSYGAGKPWVAYSWLFEVLMYGLYRTFGLSGIVAYTVLLSLGIALTLHRFVHKWRLPFLIEMVLTTAGLIALLRLISPRPWLFTILFFIIELDLLLAARKSGNVRSLLFLPPLFVVWANIHIQFTYGLFVLGAVVAESFINRRWIRSNPENDDQSLSPTYLLAIFVACVVATLITPYHFHLYQVVIELITQTGAFDFINELRAPSFRGPEHWCMLGVTLSAAFLLGRSSSVHFFPLVLLVVGAFLSFRSARDVWFVTIVSLSIIATSYTKKDKRDFFPFTWPRVGLITGIVLLVLVLSIPIRHFSEPHWRSVAAKFFPDHAAAFVAERKYPGPIYNHFNWGGYLIWRLPQLHVVIDNRMNVHGDERIKRNLETWSGRRDWNSDVELGSARLIVGDINLALMSILRSDPRFKLVYEDEVAVVFIAHEEKEAIQEPATVSRERR